MSKVFLLLLFFISSTVLAQNKKNSDSSNAAVKSTINTRLSEVEKKAEIERNINDKTFNSISTQISAASYALIVMGIIFSLVAVGVGVYVTHVERKILNISQESRELFSKNQKIKEDVEELNKLIQNDIHGLFVKIKRQETVDLIERLIKIPEDVGNVSSLLLSRELQSEDFPKLKQAFINLKKIPINSTFIKNYKVLFFQHFLSLTLKDELLEDEITNIIPDAISYSFENDIVKSTNDFGIALVDKGIINFKVAANKYFKGLTTSAFKDLQLVYLTLFNSLKTRQNRFDFLNLIEFTKEVRRAKINLGKIIIKEYSNTLLTESERLTVQQIQELELQQTTDDEEAKKVEEENKKQREIDKQKEELKKQKSDVK